MNRTQAAFSHELPVVPVRTRPVPLHLSVVRLIEVETVGPRESLNSPQENRHLLVDAAADRVKAVLAIGLSAVADELVKFTYALADASVLEPVMHRRHVKTEAADVI